MIIKEKNALPVISMLITTQPFCFACAERCATAKCAEAAYKFC